LRCIFNAKSAAFASGRPGGVLSSASVTHRLGLAAGIAGEATANQRRGRCAIARSGYLPLSPRDIQRAAAFHRFKTTRDSSRENAMLVYA
jgi:hypothetical protein